MNSPIQIHEKLSINEELVKAVVPIAMLPAVIDQTCIIAENKFKEARSILNFNAFFENSLSTDFLRPVKREDYNGRVSVMSTENRRLLLDSVNNEELLFFLDIFLSETESYKSDLIPLLKAFVSYAQALALKVTQRMVPAGAQAQTTANSEIVKILDNQILADRDLPAELEELISETDRDILRYFILYADSI